MIALVFDFAINAIASTEYEPTVTRWITKIILNAGRCGEISFLIGIELVGEHVNSNSDCLMLQYQILFQV